MSNHSPTAQGTDLSFSHKSVMSTAHEQHVICRSRGGLSANEKEGQNTSNDNNNYYDQNSRKKILKFLKAAIVETSKCMRNKKF